MNELKRDFLLNVVLVRPLYERNVGSVSRVMSNMGAFRLILIAPQCVLTYEAQQSAATGQRALKELTLYSNWESFYSTEPQGIYIAFTARDGRDRKVQELEATLRWLKEHHPQINKSNLEPINIFLFFGPEDWGLSAEDLKWVHFSCSLPTFGENNSLNLAHAVLLALYIVRAQWGGVRSPLNGQTYKGKVGSKTRNKKSEIFPETTLKIWLEEMGFDLSKRKRISVYSVFKRMLLSHAPTPKELSILEIILQQSTRKHRELTDLKKSGNPQIS